MERVEHEVDWACTWIRNVSETHMAGAKIEHEWNSHRFATIKKNHLGNASQSIAYLRTVVQEEAIEILIYKQIMFYLMRSIIWDVISSLAYGSIFKRFTINKHHNKIAYCCSCNLFLYLLGRLLLDCKKVA